eukprot:GHVS01047017.1.p1 GENE.GHVS01047017.1~~GHVS01047017.1.p1  ORF type:complete len:238 (+),score=60.25 GHVS01047017.1:188-901(+)
MDPPTTTTTGASDISAHLHQWRPVAVRHRAPSGCCLDRQQTAATAAVRLLAKRKQCCSHRSTISPTAVASFMFFAFLLPLFLQSLLPPSILSPVGQQSPSSYSLLRPSSYPSYSSYPSSPLIIASATKKQPYFPFNQTTVSNLTNFLHAITGASKFLPGPFSDVDDQTLFYNATASAAEYLTNVIFLYFNLSQIVPNAMTEIFYNKTNGTSQKLRAAGSVLADLFPLDPVPTARPVR